MSTPRPALVPVPTEPGRELSAFVHLPERPGPRPAVVLAHGFKGFMDWGFFPPLADLLCERGLVVVRFNFSGSGMRPGDELVTDLEAFRRITAGRERDELLAVLDACGDSLGEGWINPEKLAVVGHSRGGAASILAAAADAERTRLRAMVTWAAVATYERWDSDTRLQWRREGEIVITNGRTGQELPLGTDLLDELDQRSEEVDLLRAASRRTTPWLIVHGRADETVPFDEAVRLHAAAAKPKELRIVADADHTFGARHPFTGPNPCLIEAMNATQTWLLQHLV